MAQRQIARKSQLFLHTVIPVTKTHDEVVAAKLKRGKFVFTYTGGFKLLGVIVLLPCLAIFLSTTKCVDSPGWREYLLPITTAVLVAITLIMWLVFSIGWTVQNPGLYVKLDIFLVLLLSLTEIGSALATMFGCSAPETLKKVPEILGIVGAVILIVSCASLFLLYRYREEEDDENPNKHQVVESSDASWRDPRKSVAA